jgi:hypothetical protein
MIQIELNPDDGFHIVNGLDEFLSTMERSGTVEVFGVWDGKSYYVHEVGEEVYLLSQPAQDALVRLANLLIANIATKPMH